MKKHLEILTRLSGKAVPRNPILARCRWIKAPGPWVKDACLKTFLSDSLFSQASLKTDASLHNPEVVSGGSKFLRLNMSASIVFVLEDGWE